MADSLFWNTVITATGHNVPHQTSSKPRVKILDDFGSTLYEGGQVLGVPVARASAGVKRKGPQPGNIAFRLFAQQQENFESRLMLSVKATHTNESSRRPQQRHIEVYFDADNMSHFESDAPIKITSLAGEDLVGYVDVNWAISTTEAVNLQKMLGFQERRFHFRPCSNWQHVIRSTWIWPKDTSIVGD